MSQAPRSTARLYAINAASSVLTKVLQLTVLLWVNQFLLKRIDPAEYSLLPVVMSLIIVFKLLSGVFSGGFTRFFVEADARGDDEEVSRIASSMVPTLALTSAAVAIFGAVAAWHIDQLLNIEPALVADARMMLFMLIGTLALEIAVLAFTQGPYVRQRFVLLNVVELACEIVRIVVLLVLLLGVSVEVRWVVVASTVASVLQQTALLVATRRIMPALRFNGALVSWTTARRMLSFGAWTAAGAVTELVSNAGPIFILNRFSSALDVASYYLGRLPDTQLRRVVAAAAIPAQPALTSIYTRDGAAAVRELYYRGGRYHLWVALVIVAPLIVYRHELTWLYAGPQYTLTPLVLLALLGRYPFVWASAMFVRIAFAMGRVRSYYISLLLVQALTLVSMLVAVAYLDLGAQGAAIALGGSQIVLQVCVVWPLGLHLVDGEWRRFVRETLVLGCLPFAASCIACGAMAELIAMDDWLALAFGSGVGAIAYGAVLLAFCLDDVDRDLVNRARRRFFA